MGAEVQVALIAAAVTAIGWLVTHILTVWQDRVKRSREDLLQHTEKQLEELYGPIAFLVLEGHQTFRDLLNVLGRRVVFEDDKPLPEDEWKTWMFWAENDFLIRNEKIKQLLSTKTHLIEGETMPDSYVRFLNHCNSWTIKHLRWQKEVIAYSWRSSINWPRDFSDEVLETFRALHQRHASLVQKLSMSQKANDVFRRSQGTPSTKAGR